MLKKKQNKLKQKLKQEHISHEKPYKFLTDIASSTYVKEKKKQITDKIKNIAGGIEVVAKKLKGKD